MSDLLSDVEKIIAPYGYIEHSTPNYIFWVLFILALLFGAYFFKKYFLSAKKERDYTMREKTEHELAALKKTLASEIFSGKYFFAKLTEILKIYLEDQMGIALVGLTDIEVRETLSGHKKIKKLVDDIFSAGELVKFAGVAAQKEEAQKALEQAEKLLDKL